MRFVEGLFLIVCLLYLFTIKCYHVQTERYQVQLFEQSGERYEVFITIQTKTRSGDTVFIRYDTTCISCIQQELMPTDIENPEKDKVLYQVE